MEPVLENKGGNDLYEVDATEYTITDVSDEENVIENDINEENVIEKDINEEKDIIEETTVKNKPIWSYSCEFNPEAYYNENSTECTWVCCNGINIKSGKCCNFGCAASSICSHPSVLMTGSIMYYINGCIQRISFNPTTIANRSCLPYLPYLCCSYCTNTDEL